MQLAARRRSFLLLVLVLSGTVLGSCLAAAAARDTGKKPAPAPTQAPLVELVRDGATPFRIEMRSPKVVEATFAAGELVKYIAKISEATLEPADAKTPPGPRVVIGMRADLSPADRALLPKAARGHDGYALALVPGKGRMPPRIVVAGDQPRGLVYGVYDLLERLGCVFTHPRLDPSDPEPIPSLRDVTFTAGRWAVASKVRLRALAWFEWRKPNIPPATTPEELAAQIDWAMKSRYNAFESSVIEMPPDHPLSRALLAAKARGMMLQAPGHNFGLFLPGDLDTFKAHPEWFGLHDGERLMHNEFGSQFCWTNREARRVFTENVLAFVRARPYLDVLELSGLDGGRFLQVCGCAECAKRSPTDNVLDLLDGVVNALAKERPDLIVETLGGYQYSEQPPATVKPNPRLRVFWADWGRGEKVGYTNPDYTRRANLDAWVRAFDGRVTLFQYYADYFKHSWFQGALIDQMLSDREFVLQRGIDGILTLLYPDGYWWRSSVNAWLAGRVFYDASTDPFALLRQYALAYYGPAGEPMAAYLDEWARDVPLGVRARMGAMPFHFGKLRDQRRTYLTDADRLAAGDPVAQRRVATMTRLHRLAEMVMANEITGTHSDQLRDKGDLDGARAELEASRRHLAAARALAAELVAEKRGLVDPEIETSVFLAMDRAVTERDKKLAATDSPAAAASPAAASAPNATVRQ